MIWTCPVCGIKHNETAKTCICGYHDDNYVITQPKETDMMDALKKFKVLEKSITLRSDLPSEELVIKELDSWIFIFSQSDQCICLSTPALKSFRLKITIKDLEELLEFMYQKTGQEKTMRKLQLSQEEIPDLIDRIDRKIEEKKSQVRLQFNSDDLQEIADLINMKLKE